MNKLPPHSPNRKEHMARYYCSYYSNKSRGQRKKAQQNDALVNILDPVQQVPDYDYWAE